LVQGQTLPVLHAVHAHDHAIVVYGDTADLAEQLALYIAEGIVQRERTVFVHACDGAGERDRLLAEVRPDFRMLEDQGHLRVVHHRQAFEREGRIDTAHVGEVVREALQQAGRDGHRGVRLFVDASRAYLGADRADEWFAFERWLGPRLEPAAALVCAYRRSDVQGLELPLAETHGARYDALAPAT
jgi:hypothetical protein